MAQDLRKALAYTTPQLKAFGSVRNLTGGSTNGTTGDGQGNMTMTMMGGGIGG